MKATSPASGFVHRSFDSGRAGRARRGASGRVEGATALKLKGVIRGEEQVMSWEYSRYHARCDKCGKEGVCISGSDDWGRISTSWDGFKSKQPHPLAKDALLT